MSTEAISAVPPPVHLNDMDYALQKHFECAHDLIKNALSLCTAAQVPPAVVANVMVSEAALFVASAERAEDREMFTRMIERNFRPIVENYLAQIQARAVPAR